MSHAVLLGEPSHFRIKSGTNPYTRDRWGRRKKVDAARAKSQWLAFKDTLERLGARVFVLDAQKDFPGTVFPANAGFLHPKYDPIPLLKKTFYLANLAGGRAGEQAVYREFFRSLGVPTDTLPHFFEGEADFFPCGDFFIFTHGAIVPTGFRPRMGIPPWRFQFSHRSDRANLETLRRIVAPREVVEARLTDTRYYHGDTVLFAFGPGRENLSAVLEALDVESRDRLKSRLGKRLFPLSRTDAESFAANSFQLDGPGGPHIIFPAGVSDEFRRTARSLGAESTGVDVSEFFSKGGGSVKCMLCDLGPLNALSSTHV